MSETTVYAGELWHVPEEPPRAGRGEPALMAVPRGGLAVDRGGRIVAAGPLAAVQAKAPGARLVDFGDAVLVPGLVDAHAHFPQVDMLGAYGEQLLGWLKEYTYKEEAKYARVEHAKAAAARFVTELLANGTTLACVYSSVHEGATDALFAEAEARGLRLIAGKASMDRAAPPELLQSAADDAAANERLIAKWHGKDGRLFVALTPRFAVSCSEELLASLGRLAKKHPTVYVQTHHAETQEEIAEVRRLFPEDAHYLGVYDRHGLVGARTVLGHSVHAEDAEVAAMKARGCCVAHCPTSNLFLGSGLFPLTRYVEAGVPVALATDVGAGTSFSLARTMSEAYKVQQLRGGAVSPVRLLWHATQGAAHALGLGGVTGSFTAGKEADFHVVDWRRSRLLAARWGEASAFERLFAWITLGDDRLTRATYVRGKEVSRRD